MAEGVKIIVSADASKVDTGLASANKSVSGFTRRLEGIKGTAANVEARFQKMGASVAGGFSKLQNSWLGLVAAFAAFQGIKSLFDDVGRVSDLANRFGTSAESIQKLGQAAEIGGSDLESLTKALFKSQLAATEAAEGNEKMQEAFAALGLDAETFIGLPIEEKLKAISEGYVNNENKAQANAAAIAIMGKSAMDLIPTLAMGGEAIGEAMDMTNQFSTTTAEKMGEVEDRFKAFFQNLKVWAIESIGFVLDMVDKMAVGIAAAIAYAQNLTGGFTAAKQAYDDTLNAGLDMIEERKAERNEKTNAVNSSNLAAIKEEVKQEQEVKAKEEVKAEKTAEPDGETGTFEDLQKLKDQDAEREKAKRENILDGMGGALSASEDVLGGLQARQGSTTLDSLQRIGGGYANSTNTSGASKQESLLKRQIEVQQKIVDEQKKTIEAIKATAKSTVNTDGITD